MLKQLSLIFLSSMILVTPQTSAQEQISGQVVEQIVIEGAGDSVGRVLDGLSLTVGEVVSEDAISASEDWLWQHMRMRVIQVRQQAGSTIDHVIVTFVVTPKLSATADQFT
jgi:hypothetical protein